MNDPVATLRHLARRDRRPQSALPAGLPAGHGPSLFAFVSRRQERIAGLVTPRPSLVVILEGAKDLMIMGRQMRFAAGSAIALPAGCRCDVVNDPDPATGVYRALFLDFSEDLVLSVHRAHPEWRPPAVAVHRRLDVPLDPLLAAVLCHAAEGIAAEDTPPLVTEHRIMEVLLLLGMRGVLPLRPHAAAASLTEAVRALVRWQPERPWTADLLATKLGTSNASLRRKLAQEGHSLRALIRDERMAVAAVLLETDKLSVREAALATGYLSPRRFSGRYRDRVSATPPAV